MLGTLGPVRRHRLDGADVLLHRHVQTEQLILLAVSSVVDAVFTNRRLLTRYSEGRENRSAEYSQVNVDYPTY